MDEGKIFGQSISFPPRIGQDRRVAWSKGPDNIRESIRIILMTEPGERLRLPEFGCGLKNFLFRPNIPSMHRLMQEEITQSLSRWEPRIRLESVRVEKDQADERSAIITIDYSLIATGAKEQLNMNIRLGSQ